MNYRVMSLALSIILGSTGSHTAFSQTTATSLIQDIKTKSYEIIGKDTVTASFTEGSSELTESDRQNISAVVAAVRIHAVIESAIIAGWSDQEYPAAKGQKLGKIQRELANNRIGKVKNVLFDLGVKPVETHSMAEQPTWLGKIFNSEDTKLKGGGKVRDANDELNAAIGQILRDKGGPGKVVVIIRRQGDKTAH